MPRALPDTTAYLALFAFLLFVPGHGLHSSRAWILLAVVAAFRVGGAIIVGRTNPELLRERRKLVHPGQPLADRLLLTIWMAGYALVIALASSDGSGARRWGAPPLWLSITGLVLVTAGSLLVMHVLIVNAYAVTVVRAQADRGQEIVDRGAYGIVRHPMYAGGVLLVVGTCLWLESWFAAAVSIIPIAALLGRIAIEEPVLRANLEYQRYATRVRYRLVPGLW